MASHEFTPGSRLMLQRARDEAAALRHEYVGTEHLLLALLHDPDGIAVTTLRSLGVERDAVRALVLQTVTAGHAAERPQELPYTSRSKKVLELAMREARDQEHDDTGLEHVLLGLIREEMGIAAQVLAQFGVTGDRVRAALGWRQ